MAPRKPRRFCKSSAPVLAAPDVASTHEPTLIGERGLNTRSML
jgi:hypothetical protein